MTILSKPEPDELESQVHGGVELFCSIDPRSGQWAFARTVEALLPSARQFVMKRMLPGTIYRLVAPAEATTGDQYLYVRKVEPQPSGAGITYHWGIVDTREAAEMMRDVSEGPLPYFGATVVEVVLTPGT